MTKKKSPSSRNPLAKSRASGTMRSRIIADKRHQKERKFSNEQLARDLLEEDIEDQNHHEDVSK